jgi:two-component system, OmpR family, sensor histidine kinase KdpD
MGSRDGDDRRPDPEALLERARAEEQEHARSKLRVWFGASPGVGKTFTMLENAQRLKRDGVDVVVGVIETHGRKETAGLIEGLEQLPRKSISYRGRTLEEFDLDAALARQPKVILLDELAHTNAPGSRHQKRWQDATELLEAGIEVHTTLNVQHIESLNDVVAQLTHVTVRETVPDAIVERADEIELVDVPPEVVLERLREGKVYVRDQAERAASHFFKEGNLHALRELALRFTAERVDVEVEAWRRQQGIEGTWAARDRVMVCVSPSPASVRLVRAARRMAAALHAPWFAAYVERPGPSTLREADRARLTQTLRLAESLGGEVVVLSSDRAAESLLELARRRNVTRIVTGKPTHPRWRDFVYGSLLDRLIRGSGAIDVHVIAGDEGEQALARAPETRKPLALLPYAKSVVPVAVAALVSSFLLGHVDLADVAMLFLVAIAVAASFLGRGPSLFASAVSVAVFDFFFVPPYFTFAVGDLKHVLTFGVMLCAGVLISTLTERIRLQSIAAREREHRTAALYSLARALAGARDVRAIASLASDHVREVFESRALLLVDDERAPSRLSAPSPGDLELSESDRTVARWVLDHGRAAGRGHDTLPGARIVGTPLLAEGRALGVLAVMPEPESRFDDPSQRHLLATFVAQIALALERAALASEAQEAELRAEAEEMRSSLLSSVSHDLRTPIATVLGTASTLLDSGESLAPAEREELTTQIRDESARLARLVSNLLDMTRVEAGALDLHKEWVPIEELLGVALNRFEGALKDRDVRIDVPSEVLAPVDPVLFEQVLVNLLENATKHTPPGTAIEVAARAERASVVIEISDRGPGIAHGNEARIFDKFVRGEVGKGGVGLGLAICRGIVQAHGGTIVAENRAGGGALFRVTLPFEGEPPRLPSDPAAIEARG